MPEALWQQARRDLSLRIEGPIPDLTVWEHAARVAKLSVELCGLPELANRVLDRTALTAAALYHDAGWVLQVRAGQVRLADVFLRRTSDEQRELAAHWMTEQLAPLLASGAIQLAARIVRDCGNREPKLPEAQVLAEAEGLDEFGPQAIWMMVRRQMAEGRTLAEMVDLWQRQEEYRYWPARIKENLRFPSARTLAEERWQAMARFMADLRSVCSGPG